MSVSLRSEGACWPSPSSGRVVASGQGQGPKGRVTRPAMDRFGLRGAGAQRRKAPAKGRWLGADRGKGGGGGDGTPQTRNPTIPEGTG